MVLLGPIQIVVIEECTKVLTRAKWTSKFSISGHILCDHHSQHFQCIPTNALQFLH